MIERMEALDLSQGELARRVGIAQPSIWKITNGQTQNPRHLRKLARELGTTTAYLVGETDDPGSNAPDEDWLTAEEREMVELTRLLDNGDRRTLLHLARSLSRKSSPSPSVHAKQHTYRAERPKAG